jgi:hypothetical protein
MSSMPFEGLGMPESPAALPSDDEGITIANLMGVQARATGPSATKWEINVLFGIPQLIPK